MKMTSEENPYAPPQSGIGEMRLKADPESYWIEKGQLFVRNKAVLPDVCLHTGAVEGEMIRFQKILHWQPDPVGLYLSIGLVVGVGAIKPVFASWVLFLLLLNFLFRRSVMVNYCYSRGSAKILRNVYWGKIAVMVAAVAAMIFTPFEPVERLLGALALVLPGSFLFRRLARSFRVTKVKKGVATLKNVHPEALRQLQRWRTAHLR